MLYVLIGADPKARSAARHKIWKGVIEEIDARSTTLEEVLARAATSSLFGEKRAYRLENVLGLSEGEMSGDTFLDVADSLAESGHTFILEEEKVSAKPKSALAKAGAKITELKAAAKKESFNVFAVGNALGRRDRKQLWLLLVAAFEGGVAPENIAGILAWKARTMAASAKAESEKKLWSDISRQLVVIYHESHRGAGDLALLLERFALKL